MSVPYSWFDCKFSFVSPSIWHTFRDEFPSPSVLDYYIDIYTFLIHLSQIIFYTSILGKSPPPHYNKYNSNTFVFPLLKGYGPTLSRIQLKKS